MKTNNNISNQGNECISSEILLMYIKGELLGMEMNLIEKHLESCEMCRDELEGLSYLEAPDKILAIENDLNSKIDESLAEKKIVFWKSTNFYRIAASVAIILGTSSIIYYTAFRNTPNVMMTDNAEMKASAAIQVYDSTTKIEEKNVAGIKSMENQKFANKEVGQGRASTKVETVIAEEDVSDALLLDEVVDSVVVADAPVLEKQLEIKDSIADLEYFAVSEQAMEEVVVEAKAVRSERMGLLDKKNKKADISAVAGVQAPQEPLVINHENQQKLALIYFNNGVYDKALKIFSNLLYENPKSDTLKYYTGVCLFHQNEYAKSIELLKGLTHRPRFSLYHESKWYLALAFIQLEKKKSADSLLQIIIRDNSPFTEKAKQELEKL